MLAPTNSSTPRPMQPVRNTHTCTSGAEDFAQVGSATAISWTSSAPYLKQNSSRPIWPPLNAVEHHQRKIYFEQRLHPRLGTNLQITITDNRHRMLSVKRTGEKLTLRCHHMFLWAPASIVDAIALYAQHNDAHAIQLLQEYVDLHDSWIRSPAPVNETIFRTKGQFHDLAVVFERLNHRYFADKIEAKITWGSRPRPEKKSIQRHSIQLGCYVVEDQLIRIHWVLDAPDIPEFFIEWIVYHEMLHHIFPMPIIDGRRVCHSREFRRFEMQFEHYAEAILWERTHLRRLLGA